MKKPKICVLIATAAIVLIVTVIAGVMLINGANSTENVPETDTEAVTVTEPIEINTTEPVTDETTKAETTKIASDTTPDTTEEQSAITTIKIAVTENPDHSGQKNLERTVNEFIDGFTSQNPDVKVAVEYVKAIPAELGDMYDIALIAAGESIEYVTSKSADLASLAGSIPSLLQSAMNLGKYGDAQYFIPFTYDKAVIYADKSVFSALDVPIPTGKYSFDYYENLLVNLSVSKDDKLCVGTYLPYYMPYAYMMFARGLGDGMTNADGKLCISSGKTYDALSEMFTILNYGYARSWKFSAYGSDTAQCAMSLTYAAHPGYNGRYVASAIEEAANPGTNADKLLEDGNLYMMQLPTFDGRYCGTANTNGTYGFIVSSGSIHTEAAELLIRYALGESGQKTLIGYFGGIPVNKDMWNMDFWRTGYLGCEGSDNIFAGIEDDRSDKYTFMLDEKNSSFFKYSVRMDTLSWLYFYQNIGKSDHSIKEYWLTYFKDFEKYANKLAG